MKKLEEMGLVPLNKKECVEHDGGNDKPVFKGIKPDALQIEWEQILAAYIKIKKF